MNENVTPNTGVGSTDADMLTAAPARQYDKPRPFHKKFGGKPGPKGPDFKGAGFKGPNSKGPVSGSVAGQHVTLQWRHTPKSDPGLSGVSTFDGELGADGAIAGAWTYDGLPDAKGTFKAVRK